MEDPWASGSGSTWGEPAKAEGSAESTTSTDPWGNSSTFDWHATPLKTNADESSSKTLGWGGGWGRSSEAGPSRSPIRRPADSPEWSISPREADDATIRPDLTDVKLEQTAPMTSIRPIEDPPESLSIESPKYAIPDLSGLEEAVQPSSPILGDGDDFGGFSSFGDDPWGNRKKDEGWGGSMAHQFSGSPKVADAQEEVSDQGNGWGGSRSMGRPEEEDSDQGDGWGGSRSMGRPEEEDSGQGVGRGGGRSTAKPEEKGLEPGDDWGGSPSMARPEDSAGSHSVIDDAWDNKIQDRAWVGSSDHQFSGSPGPGDIQEEGSEQGQGWGGSHSMARPETSAGAHLGMNQDWEEAQKRIKVTEQRAPREKIVHLQEGWRGLVKGVIGESVLADLPEIEEEAYHRALREQEDNTYERLRSLSAIPPDINTYPPVLSSLETTERYRYALTRPNPTPETSLLNISSSRRTRQNETLHDNLDSWTSRSRLGEPETLATESTSQGDDVKPKWSFWRKNTADKPLVTSGGGILEAKSTSSSPAPLSLEPRSSNTDASPMPGPTRLSRPASPAPPAIPVAEVVHPSTASAEPAVPAQSAVTRFFGRLSRRPTTQPIPDDDDNRDMALSADDFSFLDQVPSIASQGTDRNVGDLLAFEGGRTESMASLESMLSSKATPLPPPLAPPPTWTRSSSSGPSHVKRTEIDLLEGLDFDTDTGASALQHTAAVTQSNDFDDFDDFAPAPATTATTDNFDDFGDFGGFSTPSPAIVQTKTYSTPIQTAPTLKAHSSTGHAKRASLDHTLTLNLINDASAVKGKRWPAPPSPLAPQLDPPPKAAVSSASFPFISPPPGGRFTSGINNLLDDGAKTTSASQPSPPSRIHSPPIAPSMAMAPTRTASPLTRPPANAPILNATTSQPGQSGLSAQDLSFFDNL